MRLPRIIIRYSYTIFYLLMGNCFRINGLARSQKGTLSRKLFTLNDEESIWEGHKYNLSFSWSSLGLHGFHVCGLGGPRTAAFGHQRNKSMTSMNSDSLFKSPCGKNLKDAWRGWNSAQAQRVYTHVWGLYITRIYITPIS